MTVLVRLLLALVAAVTVTGCALLESVVSDPAPEARGSAAWLSGIDGRSAGFVASDGCGLDL